MPMRCSHVAWCPGGRPSTRTGSRSFVEGYVQEPSNMMAPSEFVAMGCVYIHSDREHQRILCILSYILSCIGARKLALRLVRLATFVALSQEAFLHNQ